ncbi:hypothetical protein EDD76_106205 [Kineothrix alysoides]|uniref:Uncharacterized protein n=1 Tax=Kineothrix alysoides TaxID=1469948 RepID=A0A4R1QZW6_9FIRM|nr:hypothetical protein [Kineothrix alysoides]TCL58552.1 hypothetical protein EDD76_106205 [Kineothrix alysoides]
MKKIDELEKLEVNKKTMDISSKRMDKKFIRLGIKAAVIILGSIFIGIIIANIVNTQQIKKHQVLMTDNMTNDYSLFQLLADASANDSITIEASTSVSGIKEEKNSNIKSSSKDEDADSFKAVKAEFTGGNLPNEISVECTGYELTSYDMSFHILFTNSGDKDFNLEYYYQSTINGLKIYMDKYRTKISGDLDAGKSVLLTASYPREVLDMAGFTSIDTLEFTFGDGNEGEHSVAHFTGLNAAMDESNNNVETIIAQLSCENDEVPAGISVSYKGYELNSSSINLYFLFSNEGSEDFAILYYLQSTLNNFEVKMDKYSSGLSGSLDAGKSIMLTAQYSLEELNAARIEVIDELEFQFEDENVGEIITANFTNMNVPLDKNE